MRALEHTTRLDVTNDVPAAPVALQALRERKQRVLGEQRDVGSLMPMSELVLVDRYEAQGWRVRQDERLDRLFEARCDWVTTYGRGGQLAVDSDELSLTYDELDARANQLARYLRLHGVSAGDRIGLLLDRPADSYVAILGVLKIGAAYVPLDVGVPADRTAAIVADARVGTVLSTSSAAAQVDRQLLTLGGAELVYLDLAAPLIAEQDSRRLHEIERGGADARLAYITYTFSSDRLTGVPVDHRSICNFVKVAAEIYGIRPWDRVYQGLAAACDFSVEEIWVPWASGATLVPRPAGASLRGRRLHEFLSTRRVTALCCVPTLLATLTDDLPNLKFLLVAGAACPPGLVRRWHRPDRRFLNVYGPAEATVSATWTELEPGKPATIGIPLPTYSTVVLDLDDPSHALPHGEVGEIGIAGIGLSCGYLNRDDLTEKAFIPDFLGIPANPSGRIYRTGDRGRVTPEGEIEYLGRIDEQAAPCRNRAELDDVEPAPLPDLEIDRPRSPTAEPAPEVVDDLVASPAAPVPASDPVASAFAEVLAEVVGVDAVSMDGHFFDDLGADSMVMARFCARVRKRADLPSVSMKDVYAHSTVARLATALGPAAPPVAPVAAPMDSRVRAGLAAVLAEVLGVDEVAVDGHFFDDLGADSMVMARFCARLRKREDLPTVSMKDVYAHPTIRGLATAFAPAAPVASPVPGQSAGGLAGVLAEVMGIESVLADGHFFDDLGADSMVMARFCARVRKREDLPTVSMKDVYAHPTIRGLATALGDGAAAPGPAEPSAAAATLVAAPPAAEVARAGTREYVQCAVLQSLIFIAYSYLAANIFEQSFLWVSAGEGLLDYYLRAVEVGVVIFLVACTLPIAAKWVLIGRWKPQRQIRIWSLGYVRFWTVKTLVASNPLVLFAGSPLYVVYLRALGAKIGRGAVIFSRHAPVCTDLLTVGAGTIIRKEAYLNCYRAHAGMIQTGPVTLGNDVFVGEKAVLDIGTSMGDGSQLGHTSSLHAGQAVPAGEHWHGSPGQRTDANYRAVETTHLSTRRRVGYSLLELLNLLLLLPPLVFGIVAGLLTEMPYIAALLGPGPRAFMTWTFYGAVLAASLVLFFGSKLIALLLVFTVPRVLNLVIKPGRVYPLYGFYYSVHKTIARLSNRKFFHELFGDSSYIAHYVRALGYKLSSPLVQTGSNFGNEVKHENPFLCSVGSGTVIASGHAFINTDYSSTSFRLSRTSIGANNFLGNDIVYPPQGRTGADCLLATKVLVPIDGEVREGVGLLGSPAFEIPRTVARDSKFAQIAHGPDFPRLLAAKNRYNLATMGWFLTVRWFYYFVLTLTTFAAVDLYDTFGEWVIVLVTVVVLLFSVVYFAMVERASTGFRGVRPTYCSIYQIEFWRTERFFKFCARVGLHRIFTGTPFKALLFRMVGVRIGKRLFDDGASMAEKNIVTIGDDVTLNAGSVLQCHSQEDYAFKSDAITVGSGCTIGVGAFVHYGVTMGDGSVLAPDSFLMKGEEVPSRERWGGNPAQDMAPFSPLDLQLSSTAGTYRT